MLYLVPQNGYAKHQPRLGSSRGFEVLYEVSPADGKGTVSKQTLTDTVTSLDKRINSLGVAEPSIQIEGITVFVFNLLG